MPSSIQYIIILHHQHRCFDWARLRRITVSVDRNAYKLNSSRTPLESIVNDRNQIAMPSVCIIAVARRVHAATTYYYFVRLKEHDSILSLQNLRSREEIIRYRRWSFGPVCRECFRFLAPIPYRARDFDIRGGCREHLSTWHLYEKIGSSLTL